MSQVLQLVDGRGGLLDMLDEEARSRTAAPRREFAKWLLLRQVVMPKATDESYVSKVKAGSWSFGISASACPGAVFAGHSKHQCFVLSKINCRVKFGVCSPFCSRCKGMVRGSWGCILATGH